MTEEAKQRDLKMAEYETKVVELSAAVQDKEFEIEFFQNQVEDMKAEMEKI